jgi:hypothetical protein
MSTIEPKHSTDAAATLQEVWFTTPNLFRPAPAACPPELATLMTELQPSLQRQTRGSADRPVLLPFRNANADRTVWYACASDERQLRALEAELHAFIGPTYARFSRADEKTPLAHPEADRLLSAAGLRHFRISTGSARQDSIVVQKWRMYNDLLDRRPLRAGDLPKSFDAVRAEFDRALLARDEAAARVALAHLRDRFGMSAENRLYLEIRLHAGLEQWEAIAEHPLLRTLVQLDLPPETYGDVLEGLYMAIVATFEHRGGLPEALEAFDEGVLASAAVLFKSRRQSQRPAVLKSFILHEFRQPNPSAEVILPLREALPPDAWGALETSVRAAIEALRSPADPAQIAREALDLEQFDRAFALLWELADDVEVVRGLIRCANESGDPGRARAVLARLEALPAALRDEVEARCPITWPRVRALAAAAPDAGAPWEAQMTRQNDETLDQYVGRWREWAHSTRLDVRLREPGFGTRAALLLESIALDQPNAYRALLPAWYETFVVNPDASAELTPVYRALLDTLTLLDTQGNSDLRLARDVLLRWIEAGTSPTDYRSCLDTITRIFQQVRSPHAMRWILEVCDDLAVAACPDPAARLRLLASVIEAGREYAHRMGEGDLALLRLLASERDIPIDMPESRSAESSGADGAAVTTGIVGIYSLDEAACRRSSQVLRSLHPDLDIRVNSDAVCTPKLKSIAQRASVFVFAWKTSKHAAYYCVKDARGPSRALEMAQGAGTSSIVNAVLQSLSRLTPIEA